MPNLDDDLLGLFSEGGGLQRVLSIGSGGAGGLFDGLALPPHWDMPLPVPPAPWLPAYAAATGAAGGGSGRGAPAPRPLPSRTAVHHVAPPVNPGPLSEAERAAGWRCLDPGHPAGCTRHVPSL